MILLNYFSYLQCVVKSGLSWVDVEACSQSPEGSNYHRNFEVITKGETDGPTFVPSIAFNNVSMTMKLRTAVELRPATSSLTALPEILYARGRTIPNLNWYKSYPHGAGASDI